MNAIPLPLKRIRMSPPVELRGVSYETIRVGEANVASIELHGMLLTIDVVKEEKHHVVYASAANMAFGE